MRNMVFVLLLVLMNIGMLQAEDLMNLEKPGEEMEMVESQVGYYLLSEDIIGDEEAVSQIQKYAEYLPRTSRLYFYNQYKKTLPFLYSGINMFTFLGLGSFLQGDKFGGWADLISSGLYMSYIIFSERFVVSSEECNENDPYSGHYSTWNRTYLLDTNLGIGIALALLANKVYWAVIRPFVFRAKWNSALEETLLLNEEISRRENADSLAESFDRHSPNIISISLLQISF